jgi:hypothetical protein
VERLPDEVPTLTLRGLPEGADVAGVARHLQTNTRGWATPAHVVWIEEAPSP